MDATAEAEFRDFVVARRGALVRTAYLLTEDSSRAEDLVQEALVRAHRHWPRILRTELPDAYVRRIVVNLYCSWWRRRWFRAEQPAAAVQDRDPHDPYTAVDRQDELWRALTRLPPRMRAVLVLRFYEDLTEAETARTLDCSVGTIKSQASRGLVRLRAVLDEQRSPEVTAATAQSPVRRRKTP